MGDEFDIDSLIGGGGGGNYDIASFLGGDNALSGIDLSGLGTDLQELDLSNIFKNTDGQGIDFSGFDNLDISNLLGIDFSQIPGDYGNTINNELAALSNSGKSSSLFSGDGGLNIEDLLKTEGGEEALNRGLTDKRISLPAAVLPDKANTRGYYDETSATGEFISDPLGGLTGELTNETSGTNADSMNGYTYDKATGTWTTPTGEVYKPDKAPSNTVKSGAQVMVDAGALPKGYAGLTATKGSTADIKGGKDGTTTTKVIDNLKKVIGGGTSTKTGDKKDSNSGMLMALLALMAMMNKGGGGGSSPSAVIPSLSADRKQLPYGAASGARPGAGGVNYFSPTTYTQRAAGGGMMYGGGGISDLGGYSDGGRLLRGPGDGVSDSIPATIGGKQPARLAEGEFVVPARVVSELGNGSTNAGAQKLYAMMDRVQGARRKTKNVAANTKAHKYLPA